MNNIYTFVCYSIFFISNLHEVNATLIAKPHLRSFPVSLKMVENSSEQSSSYTFKVPFIVGMHMCFFYYQQNPEIKIMLTFHSLHANN